MNGIYIMDSEHFNNVYAEDDKKVIASMLTIKDKVYTKDDVKNHPSLLSNIDVIMGSWGMPLLDEDFLKTVPQLKAVFYAAGSIRGFITDEFFNKNILIASAWAANAVPVAEYTFAQMILSLKNMWKYGHSTAHNRIPCAGAYKSKVGIISLGMIGKLVASKLSTLDVNVFAYDPYFDKEKAKQLGITMISLKEIFQICDVVSLHTPWLKETENMIKKEHFALMKNNATFINTARGAVVNENDLIDVFSKRSDLTALLDVTYPEPPVSDSMLYQLSNIHLTPHIAGSLNNECQRMGYYMVEELKKWINHKPLTYAINKELSKRLA